MTEILDILSWALIVAGSFFTVVGAIGLLRFPDVYTRMHASSVLDPLGVSLIMAGLMVQAGWTLVTAKLIVLVVLLLFTSPVASHALGRAALHRGVKPWAADDYEEDEPSKR